MIYKTGDILGGCKLLTECGSGAFGSVFLAENLTTHQFFALKIIYKQGRLYERELQGLIAYQEKCRHSNLMRIYHVDQNDDCIYYTMDAADNLVPGNDYSPDTLGNRLRREKRLSPEIIRNMITELLDGLEILHNAGLLHRDIKPDNILWVSGRAVLGDIGLVTMKQNASFAGTPGFISPDVWNGKRDFSRQDDLYALAKVIYCALSGNPPKDYPEIPLSLTLGTGGSLIKTYNIVLAPDSKINTVSEFREVIETGISKNHKSLNTKALRIFIFYIFLPLIGISLIVFIFFAIKHYHPENVKPQSATVQANIPASTSATAQANIPASTSATAQANIPASTSATVQTNIPTSTPATAKANVPTSTSAIDSLAATLKKEWEDSCQERRKEAQKIRVPIINISKGKETTYAQRKRAEEDEAERRLRKVQREIETETEKLPQLRELATILLRYFNDVADKDSQALAKALEVQSAFIRKKNWNEVPTIISYGNYLINCADSDGRKIFAPSYIGQMEAELSKLPKSEQLLLFRYAVYTFLRSKILSGDALLQRDDPGKFLLQVDSSLKELCLFLTKYTPAH